MSWRGDMAICWRGDMGAREPRGEPPDMGVNVRRALMSATCFSHHWRCASESPVLSCQTVEIEDDMASTRSTTKGGALERRRTDPGREVVGFSILLTECRCSYRYRCMCCFIANLSR